MHSQLRYSLSATAKRMPLVSAEDLAYSKTLEKNLEDIKKELENIAESLAAREKRVKQVRSELSQEYQVSQTDHIDPYWDLMMAWDRSYSNFAKIKERLNETRILLCRLGSGMDRLRDLQTQ